MGRINRYGAILFLLVILLTSCHKKKEYIYQDTRQWVEKTVAVVAPLSDPIMNARLQRTADWMLQNIHKAQLHDNICISLKLEWHDELSEDMAVLGETLSTRDDVMAIIGPFDNDRANRLAPYCQRTGKPLILPTATSESLIRRFAITSTGNGQQPFLWSLTETDISLSEVTLSLYATFIQQYPGNVINEMAAHSALFTPDNIYGQTFFDWAPFQATELGISFSISEKYSQNTSLYERLQRYYDEIDNGPNGLFIPSFIVAENTEQLYQIARLRSQHWGIDPDDPAGDIGEGAYMRVAWAPVCYALSNVTDEAIASLGPRGVALTSGYQGFSPYADPTTGFEMSYESRFSVKPTFAECKFYDALLLSAFAASYMEHHYSDNLNNAIIAITTTDNILNGAAWSEMGMELYLTSLERGNLIGFKGACGAVQFDKDCYTAALNTTYVNWIIKDGHVMHNSYYSSTGGPQTSEALASWNWLVNNADATFDSQYSNSTNITYPTMTDQYAVLVQGSHGWSDYRHEADVLNVYHMLKAGGYDDDHIILIMADDVATAPENSDYGAVRTDAGGPNLRDGAVIDYRNADLMPQDIVNILQGTPTSNTPVVLPGDPGHNVFLFWSGHGRSVATSGVNEMAWRDQPVGSGMTASLLAQTLSDAASQGRFRQMLVCLEPCYSSNIGSALEGIPGLLAICAAGPYEQSFADSWSNELGVWMCDRFSRNLVGHATSYPQGTYRDLYIYCAQHTLGSHVSIFNHTNFGNLYTLQTRDFFIKE